MKIVLNDLYDYENMKIYQADEAFKFSLDSILLAEFVKLKENDIVVDFCTGNAVIPLILSTKYQNKIWGIELQDIIFSLAVKSVSYNKKDKQIKLINDNIANCLNYFKPESVDVLTCNPPYFKVNEKSYLNEEKIKAIARHELEIDLLTLIKNAKSILKNNGYFYLVHRSERLEEIISLLNQNNFKIKELVMIYSKHNNPSNLCLIKALKNGKSGLKILNPIYVNEYTTFQNIF